MKYFIKKGADIEAKNSNDSTPLHIAVKKGDIDIVEFLIKSGANIQAKEVNNWTPLHNAATKGETWGPFSNYRVSHSKMFFLEWDFR